MTLYTNSFSAALSTNNNTNTDTYLVKYRSVDHAVGQESVSKYTAQLTLQLPI